MLDMDMLLDVECRQNLRKTRFLTKTAKTVNTVNQNYQGGMKTSQRPRKNVLFLVSKTS